MRASTDLGMCIKHCAGYHASEDARELARLTEGELPPFAAVLPLAIQMNAKEFMSFGNAKGSKAGKVREDGESTLRACFCA